jgi:hypothetical protein
MGNHGITLKKTTAGIAHIIIMGFIRPYFAPNL